MKNSSTYFSLLAIAGLAILSSCSKSEDAKLPVITYQQEDQMARPAINTVFVASGAPKDAFNGTIPSAMGAIYTPVISAVLTGFGYTSNALGHDKATFSGILATDVLSVSLTGTTTFYDGTNVLTGRALADDVIDTELLLIFGGSTGASSPGLTSDKVAANDKAFLTTFPYLAAPF
jgi:hypothetical protein